MNNEEGPGIWNQTAFGVACLGKQQILINPEISGDMLHCTVIHETLHIIADIQNVELSEQDVCNLSIGLYSLIRNNPKLIATIQGAGPEGGTNE